jgi:hypothetical protein
MNEPFSDDGMIATFHEDKCGVCGLITMVTEPRDYRYPEITENDIKQMRVTIDCRYHK